MALLTEGDNIKMVEHTTQYMDGSIVKKVTQGDAKSDRIYKHLFVLVDESTQRTMTFYVHIKYHELYNREVYVSRVFRKVGMPEMREYVRARWNFEEEIITYEDSRGNHWDETWGVEMPYKVNHLGFINELRIKNSSSYSGFKAHHSGEICMNRAFIDRLMRRCILSNN
jgi:hypothetical protein